MVLALVWAGTLLVWCEILLWTGELLPFVGACVVGLLMLELHRAPEAEELRHGLHTHTGPVRRHLGTPSQAVAYAT